MRPEHPSEHAVTLALASINNLEAWLDAATQMSAIAEVATLGICALLAWLLAWLIARQAATASALQRNASVFFGKKIFDGVLFPLLLVALAYVGQAVLKRNMPLAIFPVAIALLLSLALIRLCVKVLQVAFNNAPVVRALERTISWLVWITLALWFSGLLPLILQELDAITWKVGSSTLSVRTLIEGVITTSTVLVLVLWVSSLVEGRLLASASGNELSLRKAVSHALRALLVFISLLITLTAVGIDLTTLSVLGGAIGVGIGFGLQKIVASYISGFVILAERSVRIGDNVRVEGFEGRITHINARYSVIRSLTGREAIVPNETFINNRIENLSLADSRVMQSTTVSVAYTSDVALVMRLLATAALAQDRVLRDPEPSVALSNFGADGLEFTLNYWMKDPENGQLNLRSCINLDILQALRTNAIEIPYPQRVVHIQQA